MKANKLLNKLGAPVNKVVFACKKHSPEILIVAGCVGVVASTVMACKATTKLSTLLEETKDTAKLIHDKAEEAKTSEVTIDYSEEDAQSDLRIVYSQTAVKVAKMYAPAVILGTLSLASIVTSNTILRKRASALAAAYAAIDTSFKEYRGRVVDRFGAEVDHELRHNIQPKEIEKTIIDGKGKEKKVTETIKVADPNLASDYAVYFTSQTSAYFEDNWEYNMSLIKAREAYYNTMLPIKQVITLNEVLESLGMEPTKAGMVVGWMYDKNNTDADNYIDFRANDVYLENGDGTYQKTITLDFNVDGNIFTRLDK